MIRKRLNYSYWKMQLNRAYFLIQECKLRLLVVAIVLCFIQPVLANRPQNSLADIQRRTLLVREMDSLLGLNSESAFERGFESLTDKIDSLEDYFLYEDIMIKASAYYRSNEKRLKQVHVLCDLGDYHFRRYAYAEAIKNAFEALEALSLSDSIITRPYELLATVYYQMGEYDKSIEYEKTAAAIALNQKDTIRYATMLNELGIFYLNEGILDSAKFVLNKSFRIFENIDDQEVSSHYHSCILDNLGEFFLIKNEPDSALFYFCKALVIRKSIEYFWGIGNTSTNIGRVLISQGLFEQALKYLNTGETFLKKSSNNFYNNEGLQRNYEAKSTAYDALGRHDSALRYYKRYKQIYDSLKNIASKQKIAELESINKLRIKEQENILLQNKMKARRKNQNYMTGGIIALIIIILLLLAFFIIKNKSLAQKKQLIKQQDQLIRNEKKINELQKEKYQHELEFKNNELHTLIEYIRKKNQMLEEVKKTLLNEANNSHAKSAESLTRAAYNIKNNLHLDKDWEVFEKQFEKTHQDFYAKLKHDFPTLTRNDLKFLTYVKIKLSTKEIASVMNINPDSVKKYRYRIKKKISTLPNESLEDAIKDY